MGNPLGLPAADWHGGAVLETESQIGLDAAGNSFRIVNYVSCNCLFLLDFFEVG